MISPGLHGEHNAFSRQFPAPLKFALQQHKHCVRRFVLPRISVAGIEVEFLRLAEEPVDLIIGQLCKCGHVPQKIRVFRPFIPCSDTDG